jgi:hypothetical protein
VGEYKVDLHYFVLKPDRLLLFLLDEKSKQKNQGCLKKVIDIFTVTKFGRVISETSSELPGLT